MKKRPYDTNSNLTLARNLSLNTRDYIFGNFATNRCYFTNIFTIVYIITTTS